MTHIAHWGAWKQIKWRPSELSPPLEAYHILHVGFAALPIIAGLDKFSNLLVNWGQYMAPMMADMLGGYTRAFMLIVGLVEIAAGVGVALKPKYFAYVVSAWLLLIIINLLMAGYYDIALRDAGLCVAALALARMSREYDHQFERKTTPQT